MNNDLAAFVPETVRASVFAWTTAIIIIIACVEPSMASPCSDGHDEYNVCLRLLKDRRYAQCTAKLNVLVSRRKCPEFIQCLGTAYYRSGNLSRAEQTFRLGLSQYPQSWYLWAGLGRVLYDKKDFKASALAMNRSRGIKFYREIMTPSGGELASAKSHQSTAVAECHARRLGMESGDCAGVTAGGNPVAADAVNSDEAILSGLDALALMDKQEAARYERAYVVMHPRLFPGPGMKSNWKSSCKFYSRATRLMELTRYEEATVALKQAAALYPFDLDYFYALARVLKLQLLPEQAEAVYRQAIAVDEHNWDSWRRLGCVLLAQKRYTDARDAFRMSLKNGPTEEGISQMDTCMRAIGTEVGIAMQRPGTAQ